MDNSKKYMKHPDNEKLPHMPESLLEYLAQFIMEAVDDTYKKELSDFISCGEYFTSSSTTEPIEYYCRYKSLINHGIIPDYIRLSKKIDFYKEIMEKIRFKDNVMYYDTDTITALKTALNKKYGVTVLSKAENIPKSLEFGLEYLFYSNSEDIKERCHFALYPPKEYKSKIERYYVLYKRHFINDEELGLLCDALYQQYSKSSK